MTPKKYPIGTIREMARIPLPERERFLAELPSILNSLADMEAAMPDLAREAHAQAPAPWRWLISPKGLAASMCRQIVSKIQWVDDDKGAGTIRMSIAPGQEPFWTRTAKMSRDHTA